MKQLDKLGGALIRQTWLAVTVILVACSSPQPWERDDYIFSDTQSDVLSALDSTLLPDSVGPHDTTVDSQKDTSGGGSDVVAGDETNADTAFTDTPFKDGASIDGEQKDSTGTDSTTATDGGDTIMPTDDRQTAPDVPAGTPIVRTCDVTFTLAGSADATAVYVPGDWNDWNPEAHPMTLVNGSWSVTFSASQYFAGTYGYKFLVNKGDAESWINDPANSLQIYDPNYVFRNSKVYFPDCGVPTFELVSAATDWSDKTVDVTVRMFTGVDNGAITKRTVTHQGKVMADPGFNPDTQTFTIHLANAKAGKHTFVFSATNANGESKPLFVPLWLEDREFDWQDAIMYFTMTDRFANGDAANDAPADCIPEDQLSKNTGWLGGDFKGLQQKIEEGYFDDLGINAIWISAPNDNPDDCVSGDLSGATYTSYHAYFPLTTNTTENHFGTLQDLKDMVATAHDHGIRILMDLAGNHVYQDSEIWALHKDWFNQQVRLCGRDDNWNQHPIECWFQSYLPDLDYRNINALETMMDMAVFWAVEADLDGFRVDAVKHMIHDFGLSLRHRVRTDLERTGLTFYLVGETFVAEWGEGTGSAEQTIMAYVSDNELNGQFNFPLYWATLDATARGDGSLSYMVDVALASQTYFTNGYDQAIMSNFIGNHDVPRFISHAGGDIADKWGNGSKDQGWNNPPDLPDGEDAFSKLKMAFAFMMTIPDIPLVYYGDEIAMPGAGDPDNRRMMQFDGLDARQSAVKDTLAGLTAFRKAHTATRGGTMVKLAGENDMAAYGLYGPGDAVVVVLNRGAARSVTLNVGAISGVPSSGPLRDAFSQDTFNVQTGSVTVDVGRLGYRILIP